MMRTLCFAVVLFSAAALAFSGGRDQAPPPAAAAPPAPAARAKTIVLVRHAEKDPRGDARDPHLSAAGTARAKTLARMLSPSGVTHLFASEFHRTQDTLAPLAAACQKTVDIVPGGELDDLTRAVDALPEGSVIVVAGHSNTVPAVAKHFGLSIAGALESKAGLALPDDAYDRLYVITVPPKAAQGGASIFEMRYGD